MQRGARQALVGRRGLLTPFLHITLPQSGWGRARYVVEGARLPQKDVPVGRPSLSRRTAPLPPPPPPAMRLATLVSAVLALQSLAALASPLDTGRRLEQRQQHQQRSSEPTTCAVIKERKEWFVPPSRLLPTLPTLTRTDADLPTPSPTIAGAPSTRTRRCRTSPPSSASRRRPRASPTSTKVRPVCSLPSRSGPVRLTPARVVPPQAFAACLTSSRPSTSG